MKKLIILLLICTLSIFFIGCTKTDTKEVNNTTINTEEPQQPAITKNKYIDQDKKTGLIYENNVIIIVFSVNATEKEINNVVKSIPGSKINDKSMSDLNIYSIKLNKKYSLQELNNLCDKLMENEYVDSASPNYVSEIGLDNE